MVLALAAARAYDERLFTLAEPAPSLARLPVVSLIAITMLVLIPAIDEIARPVLTRRQPFRPCGRVWRW